MEREHEPIQRKILLDSREGTFQQRCMSCCTHGGARDRRCSDEKNRLRADAYARVERTADFRARTFIESDKVVSPVGVLESTEVVELS